MLDQLKAMAGSDGDTDTKRKVLKDIIEMCKSALGDSVGKRDSSFGGGGMEDKGSADVVADKPKVEGSPEEEDDEKEYLKAFGGEEK